MTLMLFVGVRYSFRAGFGMGVENFFGLFDLMSSRASSSVMVVLL